MSAKSLAGASLWLWALGVMVLPSGCAAFSPARTQSENVYMLQAVSTRAPGPQQQGSLTLLVSPPRAAPGYDTPRMVYVREPYRIDYYAVNRWAAAPGQMLAPLLVQAIEQGRGFRSVVWGAVGARTNLRLDTELVRLQQEFLEHPSRVRLTLRAQLVQVANRRVIATRIFDAVEVAPSEDAYGGVVAANRALQRVLDEVAEFCMSQARQVPAGEGSGG